MLNAFIGKNRLQYYHDNVVTGNKNKTDHEMDEKMCINYRVIVEFIFE